MSRLLLVSSLLAAAAIGCASPVAEDASAEGAPSALGSETYAAYADLAKDAGAAPSPGRVTVIGLRGLSMDGAAHATSYGPSFDDTIVVLRADGTVERFEASTHPFELRSTSVPDVDGDRASDIGIIRPGVYDAAGRESDRNIAGQATWAVTRNGSGRLPGWRDTDHDGVISEAERKASERRGDGLTSVLFHQGDGKAAPAAVGCQVLPASAMRAFTAAVGGPRASFRYVLVDMTNRDASELPR